MKTLLTLLLASVASGSYAQQVASTRYAALAPTHADSVEDIHRAFRHYRRFVRVGTLVMGGALGTEIAILAPQQMEPGRRVANVTADVINAGFLASYITHWVRFSKRREAQAIERFELHQPQPLYVQRRLLAYSLSKHRF